MIKVEAADVQAIKVGVEDATKVYQGDTLVWSKGHVYTALTCEYRVESAGTYNICSAEAAAQQTTIIVDGVEVASTNSLTFDVGTHEVVFTGILSEIGYRDFYNLGGLVCVHFPTTMNSLAQFAFANCSNLEYADMSDTDVVAVNYNCFEGCTSLKEIKMASGETQVYASVYNGCRSVSSVTFSNSIGYIHTRAFMELGRDNHDALQITIPSTVKTIDHFAFYDARIEYLHLPEGLEVIGNYAFCNINPPDLFIPSTVTSIGDWAFSDIGSSWVGFVGTTPPVCGEKIFGERITPYGFIDGIRVPAASVEAYKLALPDYADQIVGY